MERCIISDICGEPNHLLEEFHPPFEVILIRLEVFDVYAGGRFFVPNTNCRPVTAVISIFIHGEVSTGKSARRTVGGGKAQKKGGLRCSLLY